MRLFVPNKEYEPPVPLPTATWLIPEAATPFISFEIKFLPDLVISIVLVNPDIALS
jgi:hypothetical protein